MVSLVVPAYNEKQNIAELVERAGRALAACEPAAVGAGEPNYELIIVDDNSPDGTADEVRRLQTDRPWLKLLVRVNEKDLSTAVTAGWNIARGDVLGCMDCDLQHPPELLPVLLGRLRRTGAGIVVGSRHIAGGGVSDWSWHRRFVSWSATLMATLVLPGTLGQVRDPMSGFFLIDRSVLDGAGLRPMGYKILLEVLARGSYSSIAEVPYIFDERSYGSSKMDASIMRKYLRHLTRLAVDTGEAWRMFKFALVGLSGVLVNYVVYAQLLTAKLPSLLPQVLGVAASIVTNFILNEWFTFPEARRAAPGFSQVMRRFSMFIGFSLAGAAINLGIAWGLFRAAGLPETAAAVAGMIAGGLWNFIMNSNVTWQAWWNRRLLALTAPDRS